MTDKTRYFKAVDGLTDGFNAYGTDDVFVGSPDVVAYFDRTGGKDGDRVLIEEVDKAAYDEFLGIEGVDPGSLGGEVVGSLPTGEDSLLETQKDGNGEPLKASTEAGDPVSNAPDPDLAEQVAEESAPAEEPAPKKSTAKS